MLPPGGTGRTSNAQARGPLRALGVAGVPEESTRWGPRSQPSPGHVTDAPLLVDRDADPREALRLVAVAPVKRLPWHPGQWGDLAPRVAFGRAQTALHTA